jgi:hypothetical protein
MLTEPVDYDLDTHPITAGAGVMEIPAGLSWHATARQTLAFVRPNRFRNRRSNGRNLRFGLARVRAPFELFSLVSGASEIGEAIREDAHLRPNIFSSSNFGFGYLVRQTLDFGDEQDQ